MTGPFPAAGTFDATCLEGLDEPVRRYFEHALTPGGPLTAGMRLEMTGRIHAGLWMPFRGSWEGDGRRFRWSVTAGPLGLPLLRVVDRFEDGHGSMDIRLRPGLKLLNAEDEDTTRSAAGRAAAEAMWAPAGLLPQFGVTWHAESDEVIVAAWDVPPERPQLRLRIDAGGAVRTASLMRWDNGRHGVPSRSSRPPSPQQPSAPSPCPTPRRFHDRRPLLESRHRRLRRQPGRRSRTALRENACRARGR